MNYLHRMKIVAQALLAEEIEVPTHERIRDIVEEVRPAFPNVTDDESEEIVLEFETDYDITIRPADVLYDVHFQPWLGAQRSTIEFHYWNRYRKLLARKGFPRQVLAEMDSDTDRIVGFLENPQKPGQWDRRGMVMGHVQSGKTGNYIGVVTKAADAGYRVIIIMAGVQNKLRDQTQRSGR